MKKKTYDLKKRLCKKYPDKYTLDMCLSRLVGRKGRCKLKALPGTGRCRKHGGCSFKPIVSGKYSRYFKDKILSKYEHFRRDPKILEVRDEIALARSLVAEVREIMNDEEIITPKYAYALREQLSNLIELVTRNVERAYKIKGAVVSIEAIPILIKQIIGVISSRLQICPHCKKDLSDSHRQMYGEMTLLRLPTLDWPKHGKNPVLEAEFKTLDRTDVSKREQSDG